MLRRVVPARLAEMDATLTEWDQRELKFSVGEVETFTPNGEDREVRYRKVERVWDSAGDLGGDDVPFPF